MWSVPNCTARRSSAQVGEEDGVIPARPRRRTRRQSGLDLLPARPERQQLSGRAAADRQVEQPQDAWRWRYSSPPRTRTPPPAGRVEPQHVDQPDRRSTSGGSLSGGSRSPPRKGDALHTSSGRWRDVTRQLRAWPASPGGTASEVLILLAPADLALAAAFSAVSRSFASTSAADADTTSRPTPARTRVRHAAPASFERAGRGRRYPLDRGAPAVRGHDPSGLSSNTALNPLTMAVLNGGTGSGGGTGCSCHRWSEP